MGDIETVREHHDHAHEHSHDKPMDAKEAVRSLLLLGQVALDAGDYESAREAYASAVKIEPNEVALYNLGSFYARGLGVRRDFVEAARLFHQAQLLGNERAGMLCGKCMFDFLNEGPVARRPADLYAAMVIFVSRVYPEAKDHKAEVARGLYAVAATHANRGEREKAEQVLQALQEYGGEE